VHFLHALLLLLDYLLHVPLVVLLLHIPSDFVISMLLVLLIKHVGVESPLSF